uniref:Uncharacterized protein n=1 Tax=Haptolina ericina TaxID=156174 RepID=A0A7S3ANP6_9EUKA
MATLTQRDSEARDERQALLHYLEALRERPDEAGESLRGPDFIKMVDKLASEGRQERSPVDFAGTGNVASLLEAVSDPRLREELLEVQRLDNVIAQALKKADAGTQSRSAVDDREAEADQAQDGTFITTTSGDARPVENVQARPASPEATEVDAGASSVRSTTFASSSAMRNRSSWVGGTGRPLGGMWISAADEARAEELLGGPEEEEDPDVDAPIAFGEGYQPPAQVAERLYEIESRLALLQQDDGGAEQPEAAASHSSSQSFSWDDVGAAAFSLGSGVASEAESDIASGAGSSSSSSRSHPPSLKGLSAKASAADASTGSGEGRPAATRAPDYLGELKDQRAERQRLQDIHRRLAVLNEHSAQEKAAGEATESQPLSAADERRLQELLADVKKQSELRVDADAATGSTAGANGVAPID